MDKGITGHWGQYKYYSCIIWLVARHGAHRHKGAVVDCILGGILGYRLVHAENVNAVLAMFHHLSVHSTFHKGADIKGGDLKLGTSCNWGVCSAGFAGVAVFRIEARASRLSRAVRYQSCKVGPGGGRPPSVMRAVLNVRLAPSVSASVCSIFFFCIFAVYYILFAIGRFGT